MPSLLKNKYGPLLRCDLLCTWYLPSSLSSKKQLYMLFTGLFAGFFLFKSHLYTVTPFVIVLCYITNLLQIFLCTWFTISCCFCNFSLLLFLFTLQINKCYSHFTVAATSATFNIPTLGLLHGIPNLEQAFCTQARNVCKKFSLVPSKKTVTREN